MKELDRFLIGEIESYNWEKYSNTNYSLARILHSDGFYFIYQGSLDKVTGYDAKFEFLGIFDTIDKVLYLESEYYNKLTESDFPKQVISKIKIEMGNAINESYTDYIETHKEDIKSKAYLKFKQYYGFKENKEHLDSSARDIFIYNTLREIKKFGYPFEIDTIPNILKYIRNKNELLNKLVQSVVNDTTESRMWGRGQGMSTDVNVTEIEKIGMKLLEIEYYLDVADRIEKDTYAESRKWKKLRAINKFAEEHKGEMKSVLVKVKHNDQELEFKYSLESIGYFNLSEYNVEVAKRDEFEKLFEDVRWHNDRDKIADIVQMKYRGRVVFDEGDI